MTFHSQSWAHRYTAMGDESEGIYEALCEVNGTACVRFGFNRPPLAMHKLPTRLRYAPDFVTTNAFVEVQGLGRDQVFKLKVEKYNSLRFWNDLHRVELFIYDQHNERHTFLTLNDIDKLLSMGVATIECFHEGVKPYFAIPAQHIFEVGEESAVA